MAQQITIDIVAETKKLTQGIDDANQQLGGMSKGLKTAATAAAGLASAFVLKQGVSFLKEGIEEAKDARQAMNDATSAFGAGSEALKKITADADKFGKALAVDNDDIIKLSTQLGSRLPADARKLSAELVNLGYDVEAFTGGAINAEAYSSKLAKAFADNVLTSKELTKIIPGLDAATYAMAETMSKAGKNQDALNLLIEAGQKKYGDAAEKNVTASQKFDVALANLKETIGTKILPVVESLVNLLTKAIDAFSSLPGPVQNVVLALTAVVGIGGPLLGFLASAKTSLITLGLVSEGAAVGTTVLSTALKAIPILAVIALIALLIANWDDVSAAAKKVWEAVSKWWGNIYDDIKKFAGDAKKWLEDNWPLILGIMTGPFGLFIAFIVKYKDEIVEKISAVWEAVRNATLEWLGKISDEVIGIWNAISDFILKAVQLIRDGIINKWNGIVTDVQKVFDALEKSVKVIWDSIVTGAGEFVQAVIDKFKTVFSTMIQVGKDIANGVWQGLSSMKNFLKNKFDEFFGDLLPGWAKLALKIASPSKVFVEVGQNIVKGLAKGVTGGVATTVPTLSGAGSYSSAAPVSITINAGLGTDPVSLGREVSSALRKYGNVSRATG